MYVYAITAQRLGRPGVPTRIIPRSLLGSKRLGMLCRSAYGTWPLGFEDDGATAEHFVGCVVPRSLNASSPVRGEDHPVPH